MGIPHSEESCRPYVLIDNGAQPSGIKYL
jgi:hypothetical protein